MPSMRALLVVIVAWLAFASAARPSAQTSGKIDFRRDIQPLIKAHCIGCHGPAQPSNNFRLDRRSAALRGGTRVVLVPGSGETSKLYLKLIGDPLAGGAQMPPTGALSMKEIALFKAWIDEGLEWPDEVSGEIAFAPPDPRATRLMEAIRNGDRTEVDRMLHDAPSVLNLRGSPDATPLMYAALYGDVDLLRLLLERGADPNLKNTRGGTALMWAVGDVEKTRVLLEKGAAATARSDDGRTPIIIASGRSGAASVVRLLLQHGANPSDKDIAGATALREATTVPDETTVRVLLEAGADVNAAGPQTLVNATAGRCLGCVSMLAKSADKRMLNAALPTTIAAFGNAEIVKVLLDQGADPNSKNQAGRTALMMAAYSDYVDVDVVKLLLERGADPNAKAPDGTTALGLARQRGETPVVELLRRAGAVSENNQESAIRLAVQRTIPLLQKSDVLFFQKTGCISCHHNSLTAMTVSLARSKGFQVDQDIANKQREIAARYMSDRRDQMLQGISVGGGPFTLSFTLLGLSAENYPADATTDAIADSVASKQLSDGRWRRNPAHRPPLEYSDFTMTALGLRALQLYTPKARTLEYERRIQHATNWLVHAKPKDTEERAYHLLGLGWGRGDTAVIQRSAQELMAQQKRDGGWSQLPTLDSDAYATGQALVALHQGGGISTDHPVYQRGLAFLLKTQFEDGSWLVRSRSIPVMPYFESGFPHGANQWISAAGTNSATMALLLAAR